MALRLPALDEALWPREWRRVRRWMGSTRGLLASGAALLFLTFILAPMLIVDFAGWGALWRLQQTPGWWFFLLAVSLQALVFLLAAVRSGQVLQKEYHGRQLEQFLLAFPDPSRTMWTILATGFVQGSLLALIALPVLLICALGKEVVAGWMFVAVFILLTAFCFLAAALGAVYFFVVHGLLPPVSRTNLINNFMVFVGCWLLLEAGCYRVGAAGTSTDVVVRGLFVATLIVVWQLIVCGWRVIARKVAMAPVLEWFIIVLGTVAAVGSVAVTPLEVYTAGRIKFWPLFLTPFPCTIGPTMNWEGLMYAQFGDAIPLPSLIAALCLFYVVGGCGLLELSRRGYARLWRNPEPIFDKPVDDDAAAHAGIPATYWRGFRNAVWTLEIRGRLRNAETATLMTFSAGVTALAGFLPVLSGLEVLTDPLRAAEVARGVFGYLVLTETALVTFLIPGLASEALGLEREHKTVELLLTTALRPSEILFGKLMGATTYLMLLVSPSLPLFAFCCLLHGATPGQTVMAYAVMLVAALVWGALGVTISATTKELLVSKYTTYGAVIVTAAIPGSPLYLAFFIGNPTGRRAFTGLTEITWMGVNWLVWALLILSAVWAAACFRLSTRWGAEG